MQAAFLRAVSVSLSHATILPNCVQVWRALPGRQQPNLQTCDGTCIPRLPPPRSSRSPASSWGGEGTTRPITATPSAMQVVRTPPHSSQQAHQPGQHRTQQQQQRSPPEQQLQRRSTSSSGGHPSSSSGCDGRPSSSGGCGSRPSNGSSDGMDGPPVPLAVMQHAAQFYGLNPATAQPGGSQTLRTQRHPHPHPYHHQTAPDAQHQPRDARQSHQHGRDVAEEEEQGENEEGAFQQAWAQQQWQQQLQQVRSNLTCVP